jgi:hypothetical protein
MRVRPSSTLKRSLARIEFFNVWFGATYVEKMITAADDRH